MTISDAAIAEPKWIVLLRETKNDPWYMYAHHKSKRPFRYKSIDHAIKGMRCMHWSKVQSGNAKVEREDRI